MVFVDELNTHDSWKLGKACHLLPQDRTSAAIDELHGIAAAIGLKFVDFKEGAWLHYDLTLEQRTTAMRIGAVPVRFLQYIQALHLAGQARHTSAATHSEFSVNTPFAGQPVDWFCPP